MLPELPAAERINYPMCCKTHSFSYGDIRTFIKLTQVITVGGVPLEVERLESMIAIVPKEVKNVE